MARRARVGDQIEALGSILTASLSQMGQEVSDLRTQLSQEVSLLRQEWGARDSQGTWLDEKTIARYSGRNRADIIRELDVLQGQVVSLREQRTLAEDRAQEHAEQATQATVQLATLTASLDAVVRGVLSGKDAAAYPSEVRQAMTQLYEVLTNLREGQS